MSQEQPPKPKHQKPLSLYPLTFDQAVDKILTAKPEPKETKKPKPEAPGGQPGK